MVLSIVFLYHITAKNSSLLVAIITSMNRFFPLPVNTVPHGVATTIVIHASQCADASRASALAGTRLTWVKTVIDSASTIEFSRCHRRHAKI